MVNDILKGELIKWNDKKGFGFIKPGLGNHDIFIHISALKKIPRKPVVGDIILYQLHNDNNGKQRAVNARIKGINISENNQNINRKAKNKKYKQKNNRFSMLVTFGLIAIIAYNVFSFLSKSFNNKETIKYDTPSSFIEQNTYEEKFTCDGKTHCSEMISCDEAYFYLNNCPGTKLDGNNDGEPCERQWCN